MYFLTRKQFHELLEGKSKTSLWEENISLQFLKSISSEVEISQTSCIWQLDHKTVWFCWDLIGYSATSSFHILSAATRRLMGQTHAKLDSNTFRVMNIHVYKSFSFSSMIVFWKESMFKLFFTASVRSSIFISSGYPRMIGSCFCSKKQCWRVDTLPGLQIRNQATASAAVNRYCLIK